VRSSSGAGNRFGRTVSNSINMYTLYTLLTPRLLTCCLAVIALASCSSRDVKKDLKIVDLRTGWYDAGIVGGQNKLVPGVSLKLQNVSAEDIASVEMNAIFRRVGETEVWGEHFIRAIGRDGLAAGKTGQPILLRSQLGYTGPQGRAQMLQNREFVDAKVDIFGKHGNKPWVKIGEYQIDRHLAAP
jgi:hypothetical protein